MDVVSLLSLLCAICIVMEITRKAPSEAEASMVRPTDQDDPAEGATRSGE